MLVVRDSKGQDRHFSRITDHLVSDAFSELTTDILFICSDKVRLPAHSSMLVRSSPLLGNIIRKEKCCKCKGETCVIRQNEPTVIHLEFKSEDVKALLSFLYTGETRFSRPAELLKLMTHLGIDVSMNIYNITRDEQMNKNVRAKDAANMVFASTQGDSPVQQEPPKEKVVTVPKKKKLDALTLNVEMAKLLKDKSCVTCLAENCSQLITKDNLTAHAKKHFMEEQANKMAGPKRKPELKIKRPAPDSTTPSEVVKAAQVSTHAQQKENSASLSSSSLENVEEPAKKKPRVIVYSSDEGSDKDDNKEETQLLIGLANSKSSPPKEEKKNEAPRLSGSSKSKSSPNKKPADCAVVPVKTPTMSPLSRHSKSPASMHKIPADKYGAGEGGIDKPFACFKCSKVFRRFRELRTHYTLDHFWDRLKADLAHLGNKCKICYKEYITEDHLVQHMGNFHSYVDKYLIKEDLYVLNEERTVRILNSKCVLCMKDFSSRSSLKGHFSTVHYNKELHREFPCTGRKCTKCGKGFDSSTNMSPQLAHIGAFHDEILKYAQSYLEMSDEDREYIPVDDFDDKTEGTPYQDPSQVVGKNLHQCQKCALKFTRLDLKVHYLENHYQEEFSRLYPKSTCVACDLKFKDIRATHKHMVCKHETFLEGILEKDKVLLPASIKKSIVQKKEEPSEEAFKLLYCQFCFKNFVTTQELKMHYVFHLKSDIPSTLQINACTFCKMPEFATVNDNLVHMAVVHTSQLLVPIMEKKGLWVNAPPKNLENAKVKRCDVRLKKLPSDSTRKSKPEAEKTPSSNTTSKEVGPGILAFFKKRPNNSPKLPDSSTNSPKASQTRTSSPKVTHPRTNSPKFANHGRPASPMKECPVMNCVETFEEKTKFYMHLLETHFWDRIEEEYKAIYQKDRNTCPICSKVLGAFGVLKVYLNHLAIEHEVVMKYVQKDLGRSDMPSINQDPSIAKPVNAPVTKTKNMASKSGGGGIKVRTPGSINKELEQKSKSLDLLNNLNSSPLSRTFEANDEDFMRKKKILDSRLGEISSEDSSDSS